MAADVAKFTAALDKAWQEFALQEVDLGGKEIVSQREREALQHIKDKFHQQLQRARGAFLQEFRNHSVVVESEVRRIREELTAKLEEQYGERIAGMKKQMDSYQANLAKSKEEMHQLQGLAAAQEAYLSAVRHKYGFEQKERLKAEMETMRVELERVTRENEDLAYQLMCRDELVTHLRGELSVLEGELKRQANSFTEEKRMYDERLRSLRIEMRQQQDVHKEQLKQCEDRLAEYQEKTGTELQLLEILSARRLEALQAMEEERERHIQARTKPTPRIGELDEQIDESTLEGGADKSVSTFSPYEMAKDARYRVDDMGMDTSWRDYHLGDLKLVPPKRKAGVPKFRVERIRAAGMAAVGHGPAAPQATQNRADSLPRTPRRLGHAVIEAP